MDQALLVTLDSPFPISQIGRVVAYHFDRHPTDAIARIRYGGGIIVERAEEADIARIAARLEEIGVETRAVPVDDLRSLPRGMRARSFELTDDHLVSRTVTGRATSIAWDAIRSIGVTLLPVETADEDDSAPRSQADSESFRKRTAYEAFGQGGSLSPRGRTLADELGELVAGPVEFGLTLYVADPFGPIRIAKDEFDFASLGPRRASHSIDQFLLLVDDLLARRPDAWRRESLDELSRTGSPRTVLRTKEEEIHNYDRWMLSWVRIVAQEPSGSSGPPDGPVARDAEGGSP